jgi:hypothetical protein
LRHTGELKLVLGLALISASWLAQAAVDDWIVTVGRAGTVEFISPTTLQTAGRIRFDVGPAGLNGIFASPDPSLLYIEGPTSENPNACCSLFSLSLATLQTRMVAWIWGSRSREAVVISEGTVYTAASIAESATVKDTGTDQLHLSPDREWLFGVRNFRGPVLDVYDLAGGQLARSLTPGGDGAYSWANGIWDGDQFYFYALSHDGAGRLWTVAPDSAQLGAGVAVPALNTSCPGDYYAGMASAAGRLFVYQTFGGKVDPIRECGEQTPGGAWVIDPATGRVLDRVAPELQFSKLIASRSGSELYGLTFGHNNSQTPVTLVRIDARTGRLLQTRTLHTDAWWITEAQLSVVPAGYAQAHL